MLSVFFPDLQTPFGLIIASAMRFPPSSLNTDSIFSLILRTTALREQNMTGAEDWASLKSVKNSRRKSEAPYIHIVTAIFQTPPNFETFLAFLRNYNNPSRSRQSFVGVFYDLKIYHNLLLSARSLLRNRFDMSSLAALCARE